jgi:hypothetical protein
MHARTLDSLAREVERSPDRRTAVKAVTTAGIGALFAAPFAAEARKHGKKHRKKRRDRCKRQGKQCRAFVNVRCEDPACKEEFLPCCDLLAQCNAGSALRCFFPD